MSEDSPMSPPAITSTPVGASPEEAAAMVAAIERFLRATSPPPAANRLAGLDRWHEAALLEGISRDPLTPMGDAGAWLKDTPPG
jgi:hypothetical protein